MTTDSVLEYPAGVSGQVWDQAGDTPVRLGRVELLLGDRAVGSSTIGADGAFGIEPGADRLLPPDVYDLVVDAPGFAPVRRRVEVRADVASCRVGRIDVEPASVG